MSNVTFLFGVHNHQPVGNFPSVFKKAFRDCYFPFLREMEKHSSVKWTLHFSGPLWEYMEKNEKDVWDLIKEMVSTGQLELMGGGFYEPILSIIPEEDRSGQIRMMSQFLEENFGVKPRGLWLTERVWEPHLAKTLHKAGIEYTLLDEEHFHYAGTKNIHTTYITEEEGYPLRLFPIDKKLRYYIPFRSLEEIKTYFNEIEALGGTAILGDDGEKFGLWPGTKKWVYQEKWLELFLHFLEEEGVQTLTYSEYLDAYPPGGRIYIPPASYEEMMEWVLEPEEQSALRELRKSVPENARRLLRGGFFREFFLKYPESNHLHKRMLFVSREVKRDNPSEKNTRSLYKSQCNDPYWHGVFGGLYLPHLRESAYGHLIEAEKNLPLTFGWEKSDYDVDGYPELLYRDETFHLIVKPSRGGGIVEVDYRPHSRNLTNVLSRRKEAYHKKNEEETHEGKSIHELPKNFPPEAQELLRYDWYPRHSLLDHFFHPDTTQEDVKSLSYGEQGDFITGEYTFELNNKTVVLEREGTVWQGQEKQPVRVRKAITPAQDRLSVAYTLENLGEKELFLNFGSEWNLYLLPEEFEVGEEEISLLKGKLSLLIQHPTELWHFPLRTLSQSEEGYDIIHQGICLLPVWKIVLPGKQTFSFDFVLKENNDA